MHLLAKVKNVSSRIGIFQFIFQWLTDVRDKVVLGNNEAIPVIVLANKVSNVNPKFSMLVQWTYGVPPLLYSAATSDCVINLVQFI